MNVQLSNAGFSTNRLAGLGSRLRSTNGTDMAFNFAALLSQLKFTGVLVLAYPDLRSVVDFDLTGGSGRVAVA